MSGKIVDIRKLEDLAMNGKWHVAIKSITRQVKWLYNNGGKSTMVIDVELVRILIEALQHKIRILENPPAIKDPGSTYDKKLGDDKICKCGHTYFQHFDSFENMVHIGCKYCRCYDFKEKTAESDQQV